ncbi:type I glyceraldehyde-3-phosphate dehydrogenase [Candidatus Methylomirabilis sp.]|uniref:type I glyceraldehyde-3-phosphate dehydrogenase n=1 Tax=Candidatus Methylomirabilis sp. TaxID=2032687 RepID=UPI002A68594C|nr:type I glyceraldehyde-3-phosphate dehydrogenase [Candidatus Methylomirabilis sp.]
MAGIAINGFGRIGRLAFRAAWEQKPGLDLVAINDPAGANTDALLLEFDSNYGPFPAKVESDEGSMRVDGKRISVFRERDWTKLRWSDVGADIVLECSGRGTKRQEAEKHLAGGARRVLISAPAKDEDLTIVLGVNQERYDPALHQIISNGSCTTNGLAPVAKVLLDAFGIQWGFMSTVHSYTNSQSIHDRGAEDVRESRAAALNIIPTDTGAARALVKVIPELAGRFNGMAFRVPTPTVSVIDLVAEVDRDVTIDAVNAAFREAAKGSLRGILDVCDRPLVSMDFKGNPHSSIVDALMTLVLKDRIVKVVAWYDNEWGYSCRMADLAAYVASQDLKRDQQRLWGVKKDAKSS